MTAILALLPQIIQLIPILTTGAKEVVGFVESVRSAAQQAGQWTPELEASFVNSLILRAKSDAWKTDSSIGS